MRISVVLTILLLLLPSNISGLIAQTDYSCMPNGGCCCVDDNGDADFAGFSVNKKCCCVAERTPAPRDEQPNPPRAVLDSAADFVSGTLCGDAVVIPMAPVVQTACSNSKNRLRAPPHPIYFSTGHILC